MPAAKYRKKPIVVEAMQWTGGNTQEVWDWVETDNFYPSLPIRPGYPAVPARLWVAANDTWLYIEDSEWIIQDVLGFYPCKDIIFQGIYEDFVSGE